MEVNGKHFLCTIFKVIAGYVAKEAKKTTEKVPPADETGQESCSDYKTFRK